MTAAAQELTKAARPVQQYVNVLISDLRVEMTKLREENAALTAARDAANLKVKQLDAQAIRLEASKKALRQKVADAERQVKKERERRRQVGPSQQLSAVQAQLAHMAAENERLQGQVKDLSYQRDQLKHRVSDLSPRGETVVEGTEVPSPQAVPVAPPVVLPDSLKGIADWVKTNLEGKLLVREKALQEAARSQYEQPQAVYRGLLLLANQYRELRMGTAKHNWTELLAQEQLTDDFSLGKSAPDKLRAGHTFIVEGRVYYMERHLKCGNSRDPRQCLRIYYAWDAERQLVIVGSLPAHLRTSAT